MGIPYHARVDERAFLNLPGFHGGAYVVAYVEDTSELGPRCDRYDCDGDCSHPLENFEARTILEIADCSDRINLEFDLTTELRRANSLHKLDTLITALRLFRAGLAAEFEQYERRARELEEVDE
ncbi:MAG TPA: hypothetical protein VIU81_06085 [Gaiellaceae bacterium]